MKKLVFGSLLGLLTIGLSPAAAQFFYRPQTNPLQPNYPFNPFTPYGAYGNPGAVGPYGYQGNVGYGTTGAFAPAVTGTGVVATAPVNLGTPAITGHPTRFFSYSNYFFNQGGAALATTGLPPVVGVNPQQQQQAGIGTAPLRGRSNTGTGAPGK